MCLMLPPARLLVQHRPQDNPCRVFFSDLGRGGHNLVPPRIYLQVEAEEGAQTMTDTYWVASAGDPPGASRRPAVPARSTACESCGRRHAVLTLTYAGADPFRLCQSCVAPGLDLVAQPVSSAPSPALRAAVPEGVR